MNERYHPRPGFQPLQQADFIRLEQAASLKGLLRPFKGKGALDAWARECTALRDRLISGPQRRVLAEARGFPFSLLPIELAQQTTGAGTHFLRWRKRDRSVMGVALWQELIMSAATPVGLLEELLAIEQARITLNMQISLVHTLARQASDCANKMLLADNTYRQRR